MRNLFILCFILIAPFAAAQELPKYDSLFVNDYAEVLSESAERQITDKLIALKSENGTEITVLTIPTRSAYGFHASFEDFARDIFNEWGVGDARKNNGVLLLVAIEDRASRIELGSGYGSAMNEVAAEILDNNILPEFADGNFESGILNGTDAMISRFGRGEPGPDEGLFSPNNVIPGTIFAVVLGFFGFKFYSNRRARRCPNCGGNEVEANKAVDDKRSRRCQNCGHEFLLPMALMSRNDNQNHGGGGGFGGGSSSGGGASGNW